MRVLALDLGTKTGWATNESAGTWVLATPKAVREQAQRRFDRRMDVRVPTLWNELENVFRVKPFDWLVFEDVQFASTTMQAHLWSAFRSVVWLFAYKNSIQVECLATGRLKQFATGHGGATKEMMAAHLASKFPQLFHKDLDDNAVDALHLMLWAHKTLKA